MTYANIIDGEIIKTGRCPKNTKITSNFYLLSEEDKNKQGWYEVVSNPPEVLPWQRYSEGEVILIEGIPTQQYNIITKTVEQLKEDKIKQLGQYVKPKFPTIEQQLNAQSKKPPKSYDTEKVDKILDDSKFWKDYHDDREIEILALLTEQEVLDFEFRTQEDIDLAQEQEMLI